ncbi:MAG: hypothetical protein WAV66_19155, partial [Anaerolineae bacterium]
FQEKQIAFDGRAGQIAGVRKLGDVEQIAALRGQKKNISILTLIPNMNNQALIHRLGFILEKLSTQLPVAGMLLDDLTNLITPRVYALDPHGSVAGSIHPRWRVRENTMLQICVRTTSASSESPDHHRAGDEEAVVAGGWVVDRGAVAQAGG